MLTRLLFFLPAFFFCTFQSFAQAYEPGLLVRSNGDTLRGEIENEFWVEPPTFIRFRPAADGPSRLFQPRELRAVLFTGGRYFRYEMLPIDYAAQVRLDRLSVGNVVSIKSDTLLAEVLLDGFGSLFRVATFGTVHYLVHCPGQPVLDLCERKYLRKNASGRQEIADGNNYRGQLAIYFAQCAAARNAAQTARFTPAALVAVVQAYNQECSPARKAGRNRLAEATPRRSVSMQGGVLLGARYNSIESPSFNLNTDCTDCQVRPFAGLYSDLFLPGRAASIYGELSMSSFRSKGAAYAGRAANGIDYILSYYDYGAWLSTARIGVRYFVPLPREQQLLFGFGFEWNSVWRPRYATTAGPKVTPFEEDLGFPEPTLFPNMGVGWRIRRLTFSVDGQLYRSRDTEGEISGNFFGKSTAVRFSTAYRLGRNPDVQHR